MNKKISVIIPTFNDWKRLSLCLEALKTQTISEDSFEIIVANNNPFDPVPLDLELSTNCKIINVSQPGSYAARNEAIKIAIGSIIVFTDSDCVPAPNWLQVGLNFFETNLNIKRIAGNVKIIANTSVDGSLEYEMMYAFKQEALANQGLSVTANFFAYKELFSIVGLFDDNRYSGGDIEWNNRASKLDLPIAYLSECIVYHPARSIPQILKKVKRIYAQHFKIKKTNFFFGLLTGIWHLRPPILALYKSYKISDNYKFDIRLKILKIVYLKYIATFAEHYRLLFGGEQGRE